MGFSTSVIGITAGAGGAFSAAKSKKGAIGTEAWIDTNNAQVAEWQAQQAQRAGADQEETSRLKTAQVMGEQRAAMAANGVDLGEGSASEVLASTAVIGEHDALTIENNTARTVWGFRNQETDYLNKAALEKSASDSINPWASATSSALSGSTAVSTSWSNNLKSSGGQSGTPPWMSIGGP